MSAMLIALYKQVMTISLYVSVHHITDTISKKNTRLWVHCVPLHDLSTLMASSDQPEVLADDSATSAQWTGNDTLPDSDPKLSKSLPCSTALLSLSAHFTLSTAPGTPGADLSVSFLSVGWPFAYHQPHVPLRGTLSAVGAIHAQKSIPTLSYTGTPLRNALFKPISSKFHNSTTHGCEHLRKKTQGTHVMYLVSGQLPNISTDWYGCLWPQAWRIQTPRGTSPPRGHEG